MIPAPSTWRLVSLVMNARGGFNGREAAGAALRSQPRVCAGIARVIEENEPPGAATAPLRASPPRSSPLLLRPALLRSALIRPPLSGSKPVRAAPRISDSFRLP